MNRKKENQNQSTIERTKDDISNISKDIIKSIIPQNNSNLNSNKRIDEKKIELQENNNEENNKDLTYSYFNQKSINNDIKQDEYLDILKNQYQII